MLVFFKWIAEIFFCNFELILGFVSCLSFLGLYFFDHDYFVTKYTVRTKTLNCASSARDFLQRPQQNEQIELYQLTLDD